MLNGIILAGGRGSRLGPLAAQISKALVSIGQRPHLVHQVELLRSNGVEDIVVVTSPDTDRQVRDLIERAELGVATVVQSEPRGPVDAIAHGMRTSSDSQHATLVIMSDTYLDAETQFPTGDWYGVCPAPAARSFCAWVGDGYRDQVVYEGDTVTIGVYRFNETRTAYYAATQTVFEDRHAPEVGMAEFLNKYEQQVGGVEQQTFASWMDVGDVMSLARARRRKFISRQHHDLDLNADGLITKRGESDEFVAQTLWMAKTSEDPALCSLVPRVHTISPSLDAYTMEFVDLPTLSELYLYWPGRPDTWQQILQSILERLDRQLWGPLVELPVTVLQVRSEKRLFVSKALSRLERVPPHWHERLAPMVHKVWHMFEGSPYVYGHGDLNFNNILFSLNSGTFKFVDPRGDMSLPLSYEMCKLAYSWHGFSEITHNLALGRRGAEIEALDEVIHERINPAKLRAGMACLFIAGAPLHPANQQERMLQRGHDILKELM